MALVKDLRENHGIFCSIVVYPVIPKGLILLRMIPTAMHTLKDVEETLHAFSTIRERLNSGLYKRLSASVAAAMGE
jgi:glycine C-acetyltransferase